MAAFVQAYGTVGFLPCKDTRLDRGYEKVVIYADPAGIPKHAARQLPNGKWTSKLGPFVDIEHTLVALQGQTYGQISTFLKRSLNWEGKSSGSLRPSPAQAP